MNKLEKITSDLYGNPVLYDYYSYEKEWTTEELNQLMLAEYLEEIEGLAVQMNRSKYAVVLKYLEIRAELDNKLAFDMKVWEGQYEDAAMYEFEEWDTDEFTKGVSVANMKVGEILEVLVRIVDPELRENIPTDLDNIWAHFMTTVTNGASGGLFGGTRITCLGLGVSESNPDKWGVLRFKANSAGHIQIGMKIKESESDEFHISKTMLVNVTE
jgi:hypothetical protein